jgi:hypothetical protein
MGLGNGNAKSGNKGSNHNFEHRQLLALGELILSSSTAGLATESTLISVLNAIVASDQDIEILLVRDTGNADQVVQQITDYQTGVPVVTYKDVNGNPYVPVGPLEYIDPSGILNLMLTELINIDAVLDTIKTDTASVVKTTLVQRSIVEESNIISGASAVSFYNASTNANATIDGVILKPGEQISFDAGSLKNTLNDIEWSTVDLIPVTPLPDLLITTLT